MDVNNTIDSCCSYAILTFWLLARIFGSAISCFSCCILRHTGCVARKTLSFFGKISLESYLFNTTIGSVLIFLFPKIHESYLNNNGYLHYVAILIIGTLLAYSVNKICERIILKK